MPQLYVGFGNTPTPSSREYRAERPNLKRPEERDSRVRYPHTAIAGGGKSATRARVLLCAISKMRRIEGRLDTAPLPVFATEELDYAYRLSA